VGDVITYTYEISNTGSLDLGAVSVTDSRLGSIGSCKFRLIVAGAPPVTCSQVYSVTQADLDAGSLVSSAQVSASSLYGSSPIVANGQVTVTAGVNSTLQLQITADPATYTKVGDNITFTYTLTNSGNVDLNGVVVTDSDSGATISGCGSSLSVGASTSCTETYSITQADITDGSLSKNGKAVASTPGGSTGSGGVQATAKISVSKAGASGAPASSAPVDFTTLPNLTPNQGAIAGSLNSLCLTSTNQTVQTQCNNLYSLSTSQLQTALQQLVPDQVAAQGANAVETSFTQLSNVRWRLGALHNNSGSNMLALSGLMLAVNDQSVPVGLLADAAGDSANIANSGRLGGFVNGRIQLGANGTTANAAGYDFTTKGVTAGIDYRLSDQLVLGGALGYANSKNDYSSSRGDMSSDGTTFSFYGSYYAPRDIYLDWIASYGSNKYNSTRNIVYSNVNTQTQGDTNGRQLGASVSLGSDLARGAWLFTPYVRAEYVEAKVNAYDESGGGGLALSYDEQTVRSFVSAAAARVARAISTSSGVYTPSAHLEWEHQYRNDQRLITARFVEDPSAPFQITTDSPDRNYFDLGLAVAATWPAGRSGFISYETVLGQTNIRDYTIDFGVRQEF
jgi:outer membrane autotransporter protein